MKIMFLHINLLERSAEGIYLFGIKNTRMLLIRACIIDDKFASYARFKAQVKKFFS